jgi:hypothetical protein
MANTPQVVVRIPPALAEAARAKIGRPDAGASELVRYALAKLAGLDDPDEHARRIWAGRRAGRPRKERQPA